MSWFSIIALIAIYAYNWSKLDEENWNNSRGHWFYHWFGAAFLTVFWAFIIDLGCVVFLGGGIILFFFVD
jgi:hypothetical protein